MPIFHKSKKTSFWVHIGSLWPQKSIRSFLGKYYNFMQKRLGSFFSSKNRLSIFKFDGNLTSWKKTHKKLYKWFQRKTLHKWANLQRVFQRLSILKSKKGSLMFDLKDYTNEKRVYTELRWQLPKDLADFKNLDWITQKQKQVCVLNEVSITSWRGT